MFIVALRKSHVHQRLTVVQDFVWQMFSQLASALYRCHSGQDAPAPGRESELNQPKPVVGIRRKDEDQIIIHRDLKPENVFLTNGSTVKLGDFGLSKLLSAHDFASTYVGTPFYMSPEICSSERYSGKSDIWSLGCIMYELCTLEPPFNARSHLELIQKIRLGKVKPLPSRYSKELGMIIATCLRVNPDERPDTAQMLQTNGIKFARMKLQSELAHAQDNSERDVLLEKLKRAEKENAVLREEVVRLKEAESHIRMEWHAKATLAIEERFNTEKVRLDGIFESEVEKRLQIHLASLPAAQGVAVSVRSSTPPPQSKTSSITTAATAASSPARPTEDDSLETEITSLSLGDDISPLGQRVKPPPRRTGRTPFTRARTAIDTFPGSPMDVQMADPSPMPPNSLRGLALSPRREARSKQGVSGQPLRRNIFAEAAKLQPSSGLNVATSVPDLFAEQGDSAFADDILEDDEGPDSPSRPTSGSSNHTTGDPFKSFNAPALRKPGLRPSLGRQQTMPVQLPQATSTRRTAILSKKDPITTTTSSRPTSRGTEKENRPPTTTRPSTVPVLATSPKRSAPTQKKELTPSRQAPKAPGIPGNRTPLAAARRAGDMMKLAQRNALQGRTLVELSQAPQSPTKWDRLVESGEVAEMPSPFLERKGRMVF
jgi:serine/threonine protein kinase